jgi:peptide deformylase
MYKLVQAPNSILNKKLKHVTKIDKAVKRIVSGMQETLDNQVDPTGVGLAANQVGIDMALFIMKPNPDSPTEVIINPKILEVVEAAEKEVIEVEEDGADVPLEGCLSIPRIWSPVTRAKKVLLSYENLRGEKKEKWFKGFRAVIVQHEVDHLNGILFTQRALEQSSKLYEEKDGKLVERKI